MMNEDDLRNRFTYHPTSVHKSDKHDIIRSVALAYSTVLNELVPDGREKSTSITKLEEVVFWANAGIARDK